MANGSQGWRTFSNGPGALGGPAEGKGSERTLRRCRLPIAVAGVLYGSLLPFQFLLPAPAELAEAFRSATELRLASVADTAVNLVVYAALGMIVAAALSAREPSVGAIIVATTLLAGAISACAEAVQLFLPARVSSSMDFVLNGLGSAIGACAWFAFQSIWPVICAGLCRGWRSAPHQLAATALALAIVTYELFPFQLVLSTEQLHERFLAARWSGLGTGIDASSPTPLRPLATELLGALWFGVLGYALTLASFESRAESRRSLAMGIRGGVLLAMLVEVLQIFSVLHIFEPGVAGIRAAAVVLGAAVAIWLVERGGGLRSIGRPRVLMPTKLLALLVAAQVVALLVERVGLGQSISIADSRAAVGIAVPFEKLWRAPLMVAIGWSFSLAARAAVLVGTTLLLARRCGARRPAGLAAFAAACTMGLAELVSGLTRSHAFDPTGTLIALGVVLSVLNGISVVRRAYAESAVYDMERGRFEPFAGGEVVRVRVRSRR